MKSFQTLYSLFQTYAQNTDSDVLALGKQLVNDGHRYMLQKYFNNEFTKEIDTVAEQQYYDLPSNYSKLKTLTITIGSLKWTPTEILTRQEWDKLNVFPYYGDIPNNFFIWNGQQAGIWPIPSTTGNTITFNYKGRVPDMKFADYTTGTLVLTNNSATVTGSGTSWVLNYLTTAGNVENLNLWLRATSPLGDDNWYRIKSIESATSLTLVNAYQGQSSSSVTYIIGQMPLLVEDFQDLPIYWAMVRYFSTINLDAEKLTAFQTMLKEGEERLAEYCGTKTVDVNLRKKAQTLNPNLFWQGT